MSAPWLDPDLPWKNQDLPWQNPNLPWNFGTLPHLSAATGTATGATTADLSVFTDLGAGTLYYVVGTSATPPSAAEVKLGQLSGGGAAVFAGSQAVTAKGTQPTVNATGLSGATTYYAYFMHENTHGTPSGVAGTSSFTTTSAFTGAGDVVASAAAWWGLRGYNTAYATGSNPAIDIVKTADGSNEQTINILSTGALNVATIAGLGYGVSVKKIYDQSGNGHHLVQATLANMPALTLNAIGSLPAITFTTNDFLASDVMTLTQPYSASGIFKRTSAFTTFMSWLGFANAGFTLIGCTNSTNTIRAYAGSAFTGTAADSANHTMQVLFDGAGSKLCIDGANTTGDTGSDNVSPAAAAYLGKDAFDSYFEGIVCEAGLWSGDKSASFAALNTNQAAYWGL